LIQGFAQYIKRLSVFSDVEAVQQFKNGRKRKANRASNPKGRKNLVPKTIVR